MYKEVATAADMQRLGSHIGTMCRGGEVIELVGDIGAGKTTFVKGLARGLDVNDDVQSPSFTISRVYSARDHLLLAHYDFYRLSDPGVMRDELSESATDPQTVTVIEWAAVVADVLPTDTLHVDIKSAVDEKRVVGFVAHGRKGERLIEDLR